MAPLTGQHLTVRALRVLRSPRDRSLRHPQLVRMIYAGISADATWEAAATATRLNAIALMTASFRRAAEMLWNPGTLRRMRTRLLVRPRTLLPRSSFRRD